MSSTNNASSTAVDIASRLITVSSGRRAVSFKLDGITHAVYIAADGTFVGHEAYAPETDPPAPSKMFLTDSVGGGDFD